MFNSLKNFERLLNNKCDIYHYERKNVSKGYGLSSVEDGYPEIPNLTDIKCHVHSETINVVQSEPYQNLTARRKAEFPLGTDIRLNDKVIFESMAYYAEVPYTVRNHHITVYLQRKDRDSYGKNRS